MATEALVYRRLATLSGGGVPTPELLHEGEGFIVTSVLEGVPWDKATTCLSRADQAELRRELGAITARLHTLAPPDGRFGYPAAESALSARGPTSNAGPTRRVARPGLRSTLYARRCRWTWRSTSRRSVTSTGC